MVLSGPRSSHLALSAAYLGKAARSSKEGGVVRDRAEFSMVLYAATNEFLLQFPADAAQFGICYEMQGPIGAVHPGKATVVGRR